MILAVIANHCALLVDLLVPEFERLALKFKVAREKVAGKSMRAFQASMPSFENLLQLFQRLKKLQMTTIPP